MSVVEAATAALRAAEDDERQRAQENEERQAAAARKTKAAAARKHRHLLDESALVTAFPGVEWEVLRVDTTERTAPVLQVRERGGDGSPVFSVTAAGVWVDYMDVSYQEGTRISRPARWRVHTALDVGRYLKHQRDALDEAYRRNPD